jgi:hypothetical protein
MVTSLTMYPRNLTWIATLLRAARAVKVPIRTFQAKSYQT